MVEKVLPLKCSCNSYPWGKKGSQSLSASLCTKTPGYSEIGKPDTKFEIDESQPYAEMWMGTYPVLPSYISTTGEDLQDVIDKHPDELLGKNMQQKFGHTKLPYLPKVLSIAKALPLQAHPNKDLSSELHAKDPQNFTDPNHKPEIALALSDFEAFVGFKPLDVAERLLQLPPLQRYLPAAKKPAFDNQTLRYAVNHMLKASEEEVAKLEDELSKISKDKLGDQAYILDLLPRLQDQYGKTDPGSIVALIMMNYLFLRPGQSIYIPADGIHAYLAGDIIECMARSNNVLNTGFCPAAERSNVDLFCSTLTFTPHSGEEAILSPERYEKSKNGKTQIYKPPMSEFNMLATELGNGEKETLGPVDGPSLLVNVKGSGKMKVAGETWYVKEGSIFFVGQGTEMEFEAESGLQVFTAVVE